ncbi:hypothetical protein Q3G72_015243 [Acer saccharum]|nr:hypothetical protein Q3G72_015243 [Acer saccharum]
MFQAQAKTQPSRKNLKWSNVNAPIQPGNVECGYYVMRCSEAVTFDVISKIEGPNGSIRFGEEHTYYCDSDSAGVLAGKDPHVLVPALMCIHKR